MPSNQPKTAAVPIRSELVPFAWLSSVFYETAIIDGIPHLTRKSIGEFLEYTNPPMSVGLLIRRNPYLLDHQTNVAVRTNCVSSNVAVYGPEGFWAIVMASNQVLSAEKKAVIENFVQHFSNISVVFKPESKPSKLPSRFTNLDEKANLVKSGKQLSDMLGVSIPKVYNLIKSKELNFPKAAKTVCQGSLAVCYYNRQDIIDFMARVDVKAKLSTDSGDSAGAKKVNKVDLASYFRFFGINQDKTSDYGVGRLDGCDDMDMDFGGAA